MRTAGTSPDARWQALSDRADEAYQQGRDNEGARLAEEAYALARRAFGEDHPDTLGRLKALVDLYECQGLASKADPLYEQLKPLRAASQRP